MTLDATPHVFDATTDSFERDILEKSMQTPLLIDFWADWCGPCKQLAPVLEKLAAEYNGAFELARVDVEKEQQLAAAFQIQSLPTVILFKDGQPVDGFPGVAPESQIRELLKRHGIEPAAAPEVVEDTPAAPLDPAAEVARLRTEVAAKPDDDGLRLDLAVALLRTGDTGEAEQLLDGLPANLATDDRTQHARARLGFAALLTDAPGEPDLLARVEADPADLHARHLLGARQLVDGRSEAALEQFLEMLRRNRDFDNGLPRKALIDAFRVIEDAEIVGRYRRKMASVLF